jgi:hypothetical protein
MEDTSGVKASAQPVLASPSAATRRQPPLEGGINAVAGHLSKAALMPLEGCIGRLPRVSPPFRPKAVGKADLVMSMT